MQASGEGCFLITISNSNENKISKVHQLTFKFSQHNRDKKLLELIAKYLNCGAVYYHNKNASVFKVAKFEDQSKIIIPFFKVYPILGITELDFQDFCRIGTLMGKGEHLTLEGLAKIKLIKDGMNTKRKI